MAAAPRSLVDEVKAGHARGWRFTPLHGKKPYLLDWQKREPANLKTTLAYARKGNVGLRTGKVSGVVVIDCDQGADVGALNLPRTVTVRTGGGGRHFYFAIPNGGTFKNTKGTIAPHVDSRGDGGQVVYPGSVHRDTGARYEWADGLSPDDVDLAPLPEHIRNLLSPSANTDVESDDADTEPYQSYRAEPKERTLRIRATVRESKAWKCLSPRGKVELLEMLDTYNGCANWGKLAEKIQKNGFPFTWDMSKEIMCEPTFLAARTDVVVHGFFNILPGHQPGEAMLFVPSGDWLRYVPTAVEQRHLDRASESKAERLRKHKDRRAQYIEARKTPQVSLGVRERKSQNTQRSLVTVGVPGPQNTPTSLGDLLQLVALALGAWCVGGENQACAQNPWPLPDLARIYPIFAVIPGGLNHAVN